MNNTNKTALIEVKINLYKILESLNRDDLSDVEQTLLFEMSFDPDVENSVRMPVEDID